MISGTEFKVAGEDGGGGGGGGAARASTLATPGKIKLVCVDSKVVDGPDGGGGGVGGGGGGG